MTVAALEAMALRDELQAGLFGISQRFFARAATVIDTPWMIAVGEDLRYPEVNAPRSATVRFINWYIGLVQIASRTDSVVCNAFHRVSNLLEAPPSLVQPRIVARVIKANFRQSKPQLTPLQSTQATN